jgi:hypothetical protein
MDNLIELLDQNPEERAKDLTDDQKRRVLELWAKSTDKRPPSLIKCVEEAWGENTDSRSWKGKLVSRFLAENELKPKLQQQYIKKERPELTPEQKEFIENNIKNMGALEIARDIFNNPHLTPLHLETRIVMDHVKTLHKAQKIPTLEEQEAEDLENDIYVPPRAVQHAVGRVNRYIMDAINYAHMNSLEKKCMNALIGYLNTRRFNVVINSFPDVEDKILFESEFIRCTYDKPDLTAEECDQYIMYGTEVIIGQNILRRIEDLEKQQDEQLAEEGGRLNLALVDAVKSLRDEYNKCIKRQNDLLDALKGKRKEKLELQVKENASILNLVNLWREETTRKQIIDLANKDQKKLKEEIERLKSMEEVKARIFGISEDEVLYG